MTPQPHDFKAALEAQAETPFGTHRTDGIRIQRLNETIRFALRLAERVCGEPSEEFIKAAFPGWSPSKMAIEVMRQEFKAMISEALKDIENGNS